MQERTIEEYIRPRGRTNSKGLETYYFWGKTIYFFQAISETIYYFQQRGDNLFILSKMRNNLFISEFSYTHSKWL